ncbi:MAG: L-fuculose kinase [Acidobacteria bacterium]|nr:L-fuculose kinase [Acidobacteriota bacterium]
MGAKTILVPCDGASSIKLEALDFDTLATVHSAAAESPAREHDGLIYNATGDEFDWFDMAIRSLPDGCREAAAVAPVARGASGGLIGADNTLMEVPGQRLTLSYTQAYPEEVNEKFAQLARSREEFFQETGSIRDFPGSLTLLKRFLFEELVRPQLLANAAGFGQYGALMGGHFIGDDYLAAVKQAGNEHSYWMCHSGTRNVQSPPGTPSRAAGKIQSFSRLVPSRPSVCYKSIGTMPAAQAAQLKLTTRPLVVPGGHDTCLSHLPILSTFYQAYPAAVGKPVLQVEAGTWTMIAQMGGAARVPGDGYTRDIIIQGTVDGEPVVTARYGGGADFAHLKKLAQSQGRGFDSSWNTAQLVKLLEEAECFVLPNINPSNHGTGPFPQVKGRIINEYAFLANGVTACLASNLLTAITTAHQVEAISLDSTVPIVLTAGGSKDPLFGALLATLTSRSVYAMYDKSGQAVTETTSVGAAIAGKAACLEIHPYEVDTGPLGIRYRQLEAFPSEVAVALQGYRARWMQQLSQEFCSTV